MDNTRAIRFTLVMASAVATGIFCSAPALHWWNWVTLFGWMGCGIFVAYYVANEEPESWYLHIIAGAGAPLILCLVLISDPSKMERIKRFFSKKI